MTNEQIEIIKDAGLKINPDKWVVCWEDYDFLEIVNARHRRIIIEKKNSKRRKKNG